MLIFSGKGNWEQRKKIRDFGVYAPFFHYTQESLSISLMFLTELIKSMIDRNTNKNGVKSLLQNQDV